MHTFIYAIICVPQKHEQRTECCTVEKRDDISELGGKQGDTLVRQC